MLLPTTLALALACSGCGAAGPTIDNGTLHPRGLVDLRPAPLTIRREFADGSCITTVVDVMGMQLSTRERGEMTDAKRAAHHHDIEMLRDVLTGTRQRVERLVQGVLGRP
ncbi:MAG: hypothetical protein ACOCXX_05345 [Planctomycetota bacterium]